MNFKYYTPKNMPCRPHNLTYQLVYHIVQCGRMPIKSGKVIFVMLIKSGAHLPYCT